MGESRMEENGTPLMEVSKAGLIHFGIQQKEYFRDIKCGKEEIRD